MKLAEIRRQTLPSKLKLRLLENEEHLFDAGLYFGFVGTVLSLVMVSLGVGKFSLMAAYSSTSFGIIFVSILKIFHVRPYRRRLILDADMAESEASASMNRSVLIVIVDFLLISLLAFSRIGEEDALTQDKEGQQMTLTSPSGDHNDLVDVLKVSLDKERESREQLDERLRQLQAQLQAGSKSWAIARNS